MYVHVGKKVYSEAEIEAMPIDEVIKLQHSIMEQQLFTANKVDTAKVLMSEDNPVKDAEYFAYKKKLRILNNVAMYLAGIKKKKNIEQNKSEDKELISILREWVGEDKFQEACALVRNKEAI